MLPEIISKNRELSVEKDTVVTKLKQNNLDILKSLYMLAFGTYEKLKER